MAKSEQLNEQLLQMVNKANRSLDAAQRHIKEHDYDFAVSRAYYAVYYLMEALLLTKEITASTHTGIIQQFSLHFIKTGIFPKEFSKSIGRLFRERQSGDYDFVSIDSEDAKKDIAMAQELLKAMKTYLKEENYVS